LSLPLIAAAVVASLGPNNVALVRRVALLAVLVALGLTVLVVLPGAASLQARADLPTHSALTFKPIYETTFNVVTLGYGPSAPAIQFAIGLDGLNIWLVALTSVLMVPAVLVSWTAVKERSNEFYAWLLVLQTAMTGVFLAFDVVLFYVFFELTLVP